MISTLSCERLRVALYGAVQGVGFRPFVYRLAADMGLNGWVLNSAEGLTIEVDGTQDQLEEFLRRLERGKPHTALVPAPATGGPGADLPDSRSLPVTMPPPRRPAFSPIWQPVRSAWRNCSTQPTGAMGIRSRTAPSAVRVTPLLATCPTTGSEPRCGISRSAPSARANSR